MTHLEHAEQLRRDPQGRHYNCAQSVLVPFARELGLTEEQAYQLGSCFGSGMLHGATCGALSAALMVAGMKGCDTQQAAAMIHQFRDDHGATDCAALLATVRERNIPRKEHCDGLVLEMVAKLDQLPPSRP